MSWDVSLYRFDQICASVHDLPSDFLDPADPARGLTTCRQYRDRVLATVEGRAEPQT